MILVLKVLEELDNKIDSTFEKDEKGPNNFSRPANALVTFVT
jgi:hypothetical protein